MIKPPVPIGGKVARDRTSYSIIALAQAATLGRQRFSAREFRFPTDGPNGSIRESEVTLNCSVRGGSRVRCLSSATGNGTHDNIEHFLRAAID
jgi:hypothetical protein